jgi:hypothetical protein
MLIRWKHVCYECNCPIDLTLIIRDPKLNLFLRDYGTWCYLRPFNLCQNVSYYKFYDLDVRRVCSSCFRRPKRVSLIDRETGTVKHKSFTKRSKTHKEVYEYFNDFVNFRKRKDLDICIVENFKRSSVCCLELFCTSILNA